MKEEVARNPDVEADDAESAEAELPPLASQALAERIVALAEQAKAMDITTLRVLELVNYTDWFVILSGRSDRHVRAVREHIQDALREEGRRPLSVEGTEHNQWVLLDYDDVIVHIFYEPVREFYELERLWRDAPRTDDVESSGRRTWDGDEDEDDDDDDDALA